MVALVRSEAVRIVLEEERKRGWKATEVGVAKEEKRLGCDILSVPPTGGEPHAVEVKGWGEGFLRSVSGRFAYDQDIRASQLEAAERDPNYRLEIVANLAAYVAGAGRYERLTLTAAEICQRAVPRLCDVRLTGMEDQIRRCTDEEPSAT